MGRDEMGDNDRYDLYYILNRIHGWEEGRNERNWPPVLSFRFFFFPSIASERGIQGMRTRVPINLASLLKRVFHNVMYLPTYLYIYIKFSINRDLQDSNGERTLETLAKIGGKGGDFFFCFFFECKGK